jgi:hypothetical protein
MPSMGRQGHFRRRGDGAQLQQAHLSMIFSENLYPLFGIML